MTVGGFPSTTIESTRTLGASLEKMTRKRCIRCSEPSTGVRRAGSAGRRPVFRVYSVIATV
ncbi:hypothetical protein EA472_01830 [Natrarchaeobius oligotrophus]|uniref:Uncharacterized protein n=1 Tax=Natrarchaeobius chitinivorans TaxID=1679083 RepID=A0A3N6MYZ3_NATCH|nr:hypothetical protein EA472_01830 [Natrarchaeobius chitinivorans]